MASARTATVTGNSNLKPAARSSRVMANSVYCISTAQVIVISVKLPTSHIITFSSRR